MVRGQDTIVIPFTVEGGSGRRLPVAGMSRLDEGAFRHGVQPGVGVWREGADGLRVQFAPAAPIPMLPPVFVPGSRANEDFERSTLGAARAVGALLGSVLESRRGDRPPSGSRPIDQTPWSGDHRPIKKGIGAENDDNVQIAPTAMSGQRTPMGVGQTMALLAFSPARAGRVADEERIGVTDER